MSGILLRRDPPRRVSRAPSRTIYEIASTGSAVLAAHPSNRGTCRFHGQCLER